MIWNIGTKGSHLRRQFLLPNRHWAAMKEVHSLAGPALCFPVSDVAALFRRSPSRRPLLVSVTL
jgi:hypothetical protein